MQLHASLRRHSTTARCWPSPVITCRPACRVKLVCRAARRNLQPAEPQQQVEPVEPASADSEAVLVAVQPEPVPASKQSSGGLGLVGVLVAAGLVGGFLYTKAKRSGDPFNDVNTVAMEELDPEIIAAARARRSQERANFKLDLDDVELPDNHPWATRKPVTAEQEAAIQARLQARPRRGPGAADARTGRARQMSRE